MAKAHFDAARLAQGKSRHQGFDNTAQGFGLFADGLAGFGDDSPGLCLEATGAYRIARAEYLVEQGYRLSVVNPAKIAA